MKAYKNGTIRAAVPLMARRSWNASTVSEQLRAAAVVGVTCGNWRPLVRPDVACAGPGNFFVPGTRGGIVALVLGFAPTDNAEDGTGVVSSAPFEGSVLLLLLCMC